jgi:hypothetical protein
MTWVEAASTSLRYSVRQQSPLKKNTLLSLAESGPCPFFGPVQNITHGIVRRAVITPPASPSGVSAKTRFRCSQFTCQTQCLPKRHN